MSEVRFSDIDLFFVPWAKAHGLAVYMQTKDQETRAVLPVDVAGNEYQIWAMPEVGVEGSEVSVGAALLRRAGMRHTFYRERKLYEFRVSVPLAQTGAALTQAWGAVKKWEEALSKSGNA